MHLHGALSYAAPNSPKPCRVTYNSVSCYFDDSDLSDCKREISLFYNNYFGELSAKVQGTTLSISQFFLCTSQTRSRYSF